MLFWIKSNHLFTLDIFVPSIIRAFVPSVIHHRGICSWLGLGLSWSRLYKSTHKNIYNYMFQLFTVKVIGYCL